MKTLVIGNSTDFVNTTDHLNKHNCAYKVRSRGLSKVVMLNGNKGIMRFYDNKMSSAFLSGMVRRDIDKFIEKKGVPFIYDKFYNTQYVNVAAIEKVIGVPVYCIDINYCYFQTAYNLGYISKKTFKRGTDGDNHTKLKEGVLAAIGGLNSLDFYEEYNKGQKVREYIDWEKHKKYSPFYWNVIAEVWYLMDECKRILGNDMYMWLTDCCYTSEKRKQEVYDLFEKKGYKCKHFIADFERVDEKNKMVYWFDTKANRTKGIPYYNNY